MLVSSFDVRLSNHSELNTLLLGRVFVGAFSWLEHKFLRQRAHWRKEQQGSAKNQAVRDYCSSRNVAVFTNSWYVKFGPSNVDCRLGSCFVNPHVRDTRAVFIAPVVLVVRRPRPGTLTRPVAEATRDFFGPGWLFGTGDRAYGFRVCRSALAGNISNIFKKEASVPSDGAELSNR